MSEPTVDGPVRVLLADDHTSVLRSLRRCLEPDVEVVGQVGDGRALVDQALLLKPDVVVVDISMPGMRGIEAVRECKARGCHAHVVFVTVHAEPDLVESALATGAEGYVLKHQAARELPDAVAAVMQGRRYVSPALWGLT